MKAKIKAHVKEYGITAPLVQDFIDRELWGAARRDIVGAINLKQREIEGLKKLYYLLQEAEERSQAITESDTGGEPPIATQRCDPSMD